MQPGSNIPPSSPGSEQQQPELNIPPVSSASRIPHRAPLRGQAYADDLMRRIDAAAAEPNGQQIQDVGGHQNLVVQPNSQLIPGNVVSNQNNPIPVNNNQQNILSMPNNQQNAPGPSNNQQNILSMPNNQQNAPGPSNYQQNIPSVPNNQQNIPSVPNNQQNAPGPSNNPGSSGYGTATMADNLMRGAAIGENPINPIISNSLLNTFPQKSMSPLTSICDPLGEHLTQSMITKIVKCEFVDLMSLLDNKDGAGVHDNNAQGGGVSFSLQDGQIMMLNNNTRRRQISNIHVWTTAFLTFTSVFINVHASRTQELLKYMTIIRTFAAKWEGYGWRTYDEHFRLRQSRYPHRPWSVIDGELWTDYVATSQLRACPLTSTASASSGPGYQHGNQQQGKQHGNQHGNQNVNQHGNQNGNQHGNQYGNQQGSPNHAFRPYKQNGNQSGSARKEPVCFAFNGRRGVPERNAVSHTYARNAKVPITANSHVLNRHLSTPISSSTQVKCIHGPLCVTCKYLSPVQVNALRPWLDQYPDRNSANILLNGFQYGFKLGYTGARAPRDSDNLKSVSLDPNALLEKLDKEISLGRIVGPFPSRPLQRLIVSPVGLVPKSEPGSFRLIQHLSFPAGSSVNDGIDRDYCAVKYATFDEAVQLVASIGSGALMAKTDIKSAFRLLPVHPDDFELLGIKVAGRYYVDKALPMGASCSPALFEKFSTFLEWVIKQVSGSSMVSHFADDFFFTGRQDSSKFSCKKVLDCFLNVCEKLGVPLASEKSVGPVTKITYLGLEIDALHQKVRVPVDKLVSISAKIDKALHKDKSTLRELQSLIGSLSFLCRAVAPGRAFLRRLIDLTCGVKESWHKIRLSSGAKYDLVMWSVFLKGFNGVSIIPDQMWVGEDDIELYTDASGTGFGGYFAGKWFQGRWPGDLGSSRSIAWLEFFPILVAVYVWGHLLAGKRVVLRSDNQSVVTIINKQTSKCPRIMKLVRAMVLRCLKYNLLLSSRHIPGRFNTIADSLSRFQVGRFWDAAPHAQPVATPVPALLWEI